MNQYNDLAARVFSRNPMEHQALLGKCLVFIGLGSVGSTLAAMAARAGVGRFLLIDPDTLEPENVCRHVCDLSDCGRPKVEAVAERILRINPLAEVAAVAQDFRRMDQGEVTGRYGQDALIVASTDSFACQSRVNQISLESGIPAVYVGCWGAATVGEILFVWPGETPCYECYAGFRRSSEELSLKDPRKYTDPDFDQTRVIAQAGLGSNILTICGFAFQVILGMLCPEIGHAREVLDPGHSLFMINVADPASPLPFWAVTPAQVRRGCGVCDPSLLEQSEPEEV